jgi:hypothetical protein
VYRAFNKPYAFFTVFNKEVEEVVHTAIGESGSLNLEATLAET